MSALRIGKNRNLVLSKYLVFEIFSYVYKDFQTIQILLSLGKQGARMVMQNRDLLFRIHRGNNQSSSVVFKMNDKLSLGFVDQVHLHNVNLMKITGGLELTDCPNE